MVTAINGVVSRNGGRRLVQRGNFTGLTHFRYRIRGRMAQRHCRYCRFRSLFQYLGAFRARRAMV